MLVPVAHPDRAARYVRVAAAFGRARGDDPIVQVLHVTELPDQTPHEVVADELAKRARTVGDRLAATDLDVEYTAEGHSCRDVAFDILQTARTDEVDLIVMGYPEEHPDVTEAVEYGAPCDVVFLSGVEVVDLSVITVGAGGGPHHVAALVQSLGEAGSEIHVVNVSPTGDGGTTEVTGETVDALDGLAVRTHAVSASSVAEGLVSTAAENGGVLVGASRTRRVRRWVFGSTPDRVVERGARAGVPVMIYASESGVPEWFGDRLFHVYRYLRRLFGPTAERRDVPADADRRESTAETDRDR